MTTAMQTLSVAPRRVFLADRDLTAGVGNDRHEGRGTLVGGMGADRLHGGRGSEFFQFDASDRLVDSGDDYLGTGQCCVETITLGAADDTPAGGTLYFADSWDRDTVTDLARVQEAPGRGTLYFADSRDRDTVTDLAPVQDTPGRATLHFADSWDRDTVTGLAHAQDAPGRGTLLLPAGTDSLDADVLTAASDNDRLLPTAGNDTIQLPDATRTESCYVEADDTLADGGEFDDLDFGSGEPAAAEVIDAARETSGAALKGNDDADLLTDEPGEDLVTDCLDIDAFYFTAAAFRDTSKDFSQGEDDLAATSVN